VLRPKFKVVCNGLPHVCHHGQQYEVNHDGLGLAEVILMDLGAVTVRCNLRASLPVRLRCRGQRGRRIRSRRRAASVTGRGAMNLGQGGRTVQF
jgi:hypothetical protein